MGRASTHVLIGGVLHSDATVPVKSGWCRDARSGGGGRSGEGGPYRGYRRFAGAQSGWPVPGRYTAGTAIVDEPWRGCALMPQPEATSRPRVDWWWDGSDRGEVWAWLLALAGVVVVFSLGTLVTAGSSPIRGIALANLQGGLGVALLPTLIALRRLDRRRRLSDFGVPGDQEVRRGLHRSLATLGLVDEDRSAAQRRAGRLPPVRPASWYRLLAACWGGFVLLGLVAAWVTAKGLFAAPDPAALAVGFAVVALPVLLAWLVVGLVALGKAARVAHWLATRAKAGRTARAPGQPFGRRLAAGPRRTAGATVAGWRGLEAGVAAGARWAAGATVAGWRGLQVGVVAAACRTAGATVAGWHGLEVRVPPAARRAADATAAGWHRLQLALAAGAQWATGATMAGWHRLEVSVPPAARRAADATAAGWHRLQLGLAAGAHWATGATMAGWHRLEVSVPPAARRAADATAAGWHRLQLGLAAGAQWATGATMAGWHRLEVSVPPAARRAADATAAGWHRLQLGLAAGAHWATGATMAGWHRLE